MKRDTSVRIALFVAVGVITALSVYAHDQIPAPPQKQPIALVGGTVHTVSGPVYENVTILFENGTIVDIGANIAVPGDALTVDVTGKHVYPGLIEPLSVIGLAEINSVRATVDYLETGDMNPNVRAERAFNPDSERIPVTRSNGVALAGSVPVGGLVSGMAALMMLDGWTWEDMTLKAPVGMVINWPRMNVTAAYGKQKSGDERRKQIKERLDALDEAFRDARAYMAARDAAGKKGVPFHDTDVRWEAMLPVLRGEVPVWIRADRLPEIESAVEWADRHQVKMVLVGGIEAPRAAGLLKRKDIPVIVSSVLRFPSHRYSEYDEAYTVPARLSEAGVKFSIAGSSGAGNERNLPYHAAMAAAFGLPAEEALKAVTLYSAEILGVADRVGSLEKGKDATLIVTDGDPLEITTNVEMLYIQGRNVDLNNKQKMLFEKYREKYRQIAGK